MNSALDDYFSALAKDATAATGKVLDGGTVIAPSPDRSGSGAATSYPTPSGTIIWCDPALVDTLTDVLGAETDRAIESADFVPLATSHGATLLGFGNNRILVGGVRHPSAGATNVVARRLDRGDPGDKTLLAELASVASEDDRDEAEFYLDDLDPFIVGVLEGDCLVAFGSGRVSDLDDRFDDIGVLTHPEHRRRGLGALAVGEFVRHRLAADPARRMLYRCSIENVGSNGIAESLGFTLAHTIGAVRFP